MIPKRISSRELRKQLGISRGQLKKLEQAGAFGEGVRYQDHEQSPRYYLVEKVDAFLAAREAQARSEGGIARARAQRILRRTR